jgi:hypothetical protein
MAGGIAWLADRLASFHLEGMERVRKLQARERESEMIKRLRDDRNLSTYPISRRDYYCVECGLSYRLSRERIKEDKPSHITFVCDICLDI